MPGDNREIYWVSAYSEDILIQQTDADYLEQVLVCQSACAGNYGNIGWKWLISRLGYFMPSNTTIN